MEIADNAGISDAERDDPPEGNETSVAHRNPDEVDERDSVSDAQVWMSRELSERLAESADVSREDRERASELIDDNSEYAELADQYAEVSNEGEPESGRIEGDPLDATGQLQREFFAEARLYQRTHEDYREAREENETLRTRRLAHELERRAAEVNRTASRLDESYADMESLDEGERRNATRSISEVRSNVTRTQLTVRNRTLVRTELSVEATEPVGSFVDPVPLDGRLQTADGDPVADENVTLRVGNRTLDATTDGDGRFEVAYRPTLAPAGERARTVEFLPANESVYVRDDATARFEIRRVEPNVTIADASSPVGYNDTLSVEGSVAGDGVGAPDVPLAVTVDGVPIAQVRTAEDGSFDAAGRFPANVSPGDRRVDVGLALDTATSRADGPVALAGANGTAAVTVEETRTSLSTTEVRTFNETVYVAGRLATEDGDPLANRTVDLRVDGRTIGNATTNATGEYATTATVSKGSVSADSSAEVVAAYSPSDGNLGPARASATATFDANDSAFSAEQLGLGVVGLLGVTILGAFVWRFRADEAERSDRETDADAQANAIADTGRPSPESLFDSATVALEADEFDAAVVAAYVAVRHLLSRGSRPVAGPLDSSGRTHWEFYDACRAAGLPDERLRTLKQLTETYERAAFAPGEVPEAVATDAVASATAFGSDGGPDSPTRSGE
ncbi:hypothetical protein NGM10_16810 (plasmid) [Halorussus salilacus]|uniref:hypothetical protein n=1 Tax=Halorussus salilacus TaxID=2953750 RepID=UPI00209E2D84|nr:hypothetical protein [Halorussus salilacus]USZ69757.1 hypothetical protein NGM10_16810 [Halorussus salilacus]